MLLAAESDWFSHPRYPFAFSSSALSNAAPAAPRIVLCESTVNFQSSTPHGRSRPTVVVIPLPESTSNRGWGRSLDVIYCTGCSGALGSFISCGRLRNAFQTSMISSGFAFFVSFTETDSVLPSSQDTRSPSALMQNEPTPPPEPFHLRSVLA